MGKPLSLDLRRRIVACVEAGQSRRAAAAKFDVSPSFVIELRRTSHLPPRAPPGMTSGGGTIFATSRVILTLRASG